MLIKSWNGSIIISKINIEQIYNIIENIIVSIALFTEVNVYNKMQILYLLCIIQYFTIPLYTMS